MLFPWKWSDFQSETTVGKLSKSTIHKFANISCTRIAHCPNSRNFHVTNISCSTVSIRPLNFWQPFSPNLINIFVRWKKDSNSTFYLVDCDEFFIFWTLYRFRCSLQKNYYIVIVTYINIKEGSNSALVVCLPEMVALLPVDWEVVPSWELDRFHITPMRNLYHHKNHHYHAKPETYRKQYLFNNLANHQEK